MRYLMTSVLAVSILAATPALAQPPGTFGPQQGDHELTLGAGGQNDHDFNRGQANATFQLGNYVTRNWLLGVRQDVNWSGGSDSRDTWNAGTRLFADFHLDMGELRPFIGANLGYRYGDAVRDTWVAGPQAGAKWYVRDTTFVFGRAEYEFFFRDNEDIDDGFEDGQFIYTVGIGLNF
ncbi:MAG: hypothetical protein WD009_00345 [Phycisphaeraceae bacterium]